MIKIVTIGCPCGYTFKEKKRIETRTYPASGVITCRPGHAPVKHDQPTTKNVIVERATLQGDEPFKTFTVLVKYYLRSPEGKHIALLACPKCGTVLYPPIAAKTEVIKE